MPERVRGYPDQPGALAGFEGLLQQELPAELRLRVYTTAISIAANVEDCVDKNGNGTIETSKSKDDVLPWLADECMIWEKVWPYAGQFQDGPRGTTWTPGTWSYDECKYVDPKIWIGYQAPGVVGHFVRVSVTGVVEETVVVPGFNGEGYSPYGGALDPEFRPWFTGLRGEFLRINTEENPASVTRINPPGATQTYGFTVDGEPRIRVRMRPLTAHLQLQSDKNPLQHLLHAIKKKEYRMGFMATAILTMGGFMLMPFTSAFLVNNVAVSQEELPLIFLFTGLSSIIIMPIIGKISDKIDKFRLFTIGSLIAVVMIVVYTNLTPIPVGDHEPHGTCNGVELRYS